MTGKYPAAIALFVTCSLFSLAAQAVPWASYTGRPTPWDRTQMPPWKADVEIGYVKTGGNTDIDTLNAKGKIINIRENWRHTGRVEAVRVRNNDVLTGERYLASVKSDYNINEDSYGFGFLTYQEDTFSGYDYEFTQVLGYGRRLIHREELGLNVEIGAGARQSKLIAEGSERESEPVAHLALDVDWLLNPYLSLSEDLSSEIGRTKTVTRSVTALKSKINSKLSSKVSYTIRHTTDVPPGILETDTELAVTLVYLIF